MNLIPPRALAEEISRYPADLQAQVIADVTKFVAQNLQATLQEAKEQHDYYQNANSKFNNNVDQIIQTATH